MTREEQIKAVEGVLEKPSKNKEVNINFQVINANKRRLLATAVVDSFIRKLLEEEPTKQMNQLIKKCQDSRQVKSQCADELEEITKLYVLKDKDLDSLIKKWREK